MREVQFVEFQYYLVLLKVALGHQFFSGRMCFNTT